MKLTKHPDNLFHQAEFTSVHPFLPSQTGQPGNHRSTQLHIATSQFGQKPGLDDI